MTGSSSKLLQIQGKWYRERRAKKNLTPEAIKKPKTILHPLKEDRRGIRWNDRSNANNSIRFAFQDWGYDQHGSWSWCSNYIWTRAERFTDWAPEFLSSPVDRASSVVVLPLVCNYETIGSYVPAMQRTLHSSLRWLPAGIWGRKVGSREPLCGGQSCLPNLARPEAAKLVSRTLQVLSLPAHRQDVMQQAWKAQVTDSCVFSVCYSWQVAGLAQ